MWLFAILNIIIIEWNDKHFEWYELQVIPKFEWFNTLLRVHKRPFDYDTFSEAQNMVNEPQVNGG